MTPVRLPLLILLVVAVADVGTGQDTVFYPFLILCPALAALTATPRAVVLVGLVCFPVRYLLSRYDHPEEPLTSSVFLANSAVFLVAIVLCAYQARLRIRRETTLADVTSVALAAQEVLLPTLPSTVGGVRISMRYFAAAAEARIGGDLYAAVDTPFGTRILIADVCGKGLGAVRTASLVLSAFREAALDDPDLATVAHRADTNVSRFSDDGDFVTALLVEVHPTHLALLHRGHVAPILVGPSGVRDLDPPAPGLPLGLGQLGPEADTPWTTAFHPGEVLVLVTDGVLEARDANGAFYPLHDRLGVLMDPPDPDHAWGQGNLDRAADRIGADLLGHAHGKARNDDAVVMLITRTGPA
ncbi:PP2C family protein-serine/threonine phosphatase [Kitasatospora sp. NPDC101801]|uniref:PP2C family protein-serine/threonine phosphatase n=1 Tax=Kitasatospora sp. NPDC101801 TaxID=3364103 RepID=UPI0037F3BE42